MNILHNSCIGGISTYCVPSVRFFANFSSMNGITGIGVSLCWGNNLKTAALRVAASSFVKKAGCGTDDSLLSTICLV